MSIEANKELARRFFAEVADERRLDRAAELLVADYQHHDPGLPPQMQHGRDAYVSHFPMYYAAFPDLRMAIEDILAEDDRVVTRWSFSGTHGGELMGIPPTGKAVRASGITIQRIADGKIVEGWTIFDTLGLLQQLGVIPVPGQ